jgi:hypothetical protein
LAHKKHANTRSAPIVQDAWLNSRQKLTMGIILPFTLLVIVAAGMYDNDRTIIALERGGIQCQATVTGKLSDDSYGHGHHYLDLRFREANNNTVSHLVEPSYSDYHAAVVGGSVIITYVPTDLSIIKIGRVAPHQVESYVYIQIVALVVILIGWAWILSRVLPEFLTLKAERSRRQQT